MSWFKKLALALFVASVGVTGLAQNSVSAVALKVQPLSYQEALAKGEKKKGFIDVTNPTSQTIRLKTSVQAFRQIDNNGSLQFYDNEQIVAGIIPDLDEFTLKAGQTMRLMFLVDGTKLPEGDIFAGLTITNEPEQRGNVAQAVRVGTLIILTNGTPGARQAEVTALDAPILQFDSGVRGTYSIKNTAPSNTSSGFSPEVTVSLKPFGVSKKQKSSLIFAGRERENQFELGAHRFGIYNLTVSYGDSHKSKWIVLISPLILGIIILGILALGIGGLYVRRRRRAVGFNKH